MRKQRAQGSLQVWLVGVGLLVGGLQAPVIAQQGASTAEATVPAELMRLNGSVERLVEMMQEFLAGQEADLLMKRLEILQRRLLPNQEELQRVRRSYDNTVENIEAIDARLEIFERAFEEEEQAGEAPSEADREMFTLEFTAQRERLVTRRDSLWLQLEALENRVGMSRDNILALEDLLDEKLGLR